jgi:hypothetical protein
MEFITKFFMICSPFGQADFTASAVLQAIRSEAPRLHSLCALRLRQTQFVRKAV